MLEFVRQKTSGHYLIGDVSDPIRAVTLLFGCEPLSSDTQELKGSRTTGERWGIETEYSHHEAYGRLISTDMYTLCETPYHAPNMLSQNGFYAVKLQEDNYIRSIGLKPNTQSVEVWYDRLNSRYVRVTHLYRVSALNRNTLRFSVHYISTVTTSKDVNFSDIVSQKTCEGDFAGKCSIIINSNDLPRMDAVEEFSIPQEYTVPDPANSLGERQCDYLLWECLTDISNQIRNTNCNLALYCHDMLTINSLVEPIMAGARYLVSGKKGLVDTAKVCASNFLNWYYGIRLSIYDTREIAGSVKDAFDTQLVSKDDFMSDEVVKSLVVHNIDKSITEGPRIKGSCANMDWYQTAIVSGQFKGSYKQFCQYVDILNCEVCNSDITPLGFFLANVTRSSVQNYMNTYKSYHSRRKGNIGSTELTVCCKGYFSPYAQQDTYKALLSMLKCWDLWPSQENVIDFVPLSFVLNWIWTIPNYLKYDETNDIFKTLNVAKLLVSNKYTQYIDSEFGSYEYEMYDRFFLDSLPPVPYNIGLKDLVASGLDHYAEGTSLAISLAK